VKPKPPVPLWRWALWLSILGAALVVFYVLLTPIWIGLRAAAWLAEFRARRRRVQIARQPREGEPDV
jgi:ABC-type phosphate transport system permease subunit